MTKWFLVHSQNRFVWSKNFGMGGERPVASPTGLMVHSSDQSCYYVRVGWSMQACCVVRLGGELRGASALEISAVGRHARHVVCIGLFTLFVYNRRRPRYPASATLNAATWCSIPLRC